jgi:RNA polymerase sigma-70 factor (ECF subfamily)
LRLFSLAVNLSPERKEIMHRTMVATVVVLVYCGLAWSAEPEKKSVATMPPVVVKTVPQAGDMKVDPASTKIEVTFSKRMAIGKNYSWIGGGETYPETTGEPRWKADGRTCVLPVKLAPGKTYILWLNSPQYGNFRDAKGQSAIPYLIVFETAKK